MSRLKHDWQYSIPDGLYTCSRCRQTGSLATEVLLSYGGAIKPDMATVDPVYCPAEDVHTALSPEQIDEALAKNDLPDDDRFSDPAVETTGSPQEVFHRLLVGSDGRVAIHFTAPVEFYTMTPAEAFGMAESILKAAYTARERQEGILSPLGKRVIDGPDKAS